jgi:hypothetical protein
MVWVFIWEWLDIYWLLEVPDLLPHALTIWISFYWMNSGILLSRWRWSKGVTLCGFSLMMWELVLIRDNLWCRLLLLLLLKLACFISVW